MCKKIEVFISKHPDILAKPAYPWTPNVFGSSLASFLTYIDYELVLPMHWWTVLKGPVQASNGLLRMFSKLTFKTKATIFFMPKSYFIKSINNLIFWHLIGNFRNDVISLHQRLIGVRSYPAIFFFIWYSLKFCQICFSINKDLLVRIGR